MSETKPIQTVERLVAAHKEVSDAVVRQWNGQAALKISIPARPEHDSDLIICGAIRQAETVIAELYEALEELVGVNEKWNADVQSIIGRPPSWTDQYLTTARLALKKARGEQ